VIIAVARDLPPGARPIDARPANRSEQSGEGGKSGRTQAPQGAAYKTAVTKILLPRSLKWDPDFYLACFQMGPISAQIGPCYLRQVRGAASQCPKLDNCDLLAEES
jgi:hypothetical protein